MLSFRSCRINTNTQTHSHVGWRLTRIVQRTTIDQLSPLVRYVEVRCAVIQEPAPREAPLIGSSRAPQDRVYRFNPSQRDYMQPDAQYAPFVRPRCRPGWRVPRD